MVHQKNKDYKLNTCSVAVHVTAYTLFIASQMVFYFSALNKKGQETQKNFGITINVKTFFLSVS